MLNTHETASETAASRPPEAQDSQAAPVQSRNGGWHIYIGETVYGPFSARQMTAYVTEGRLNAASRVSQSPEGPFRPIRETGPLAESLRGAFAERARLRAQASNFLIIVRAPAPAEAALWRSLPECLGKLGKYTQPMPGTWLLRSSETLKSVRSVLVSTLPRTVQVIVLETRDARLDWVGFDDTINDTVRTVWNAPL